MVRHCWSFVSSEDEPAAAAVRAAADDQQVHPRAALPALEWLHVLALLTHGPEHPDVARPLINMGIAEEELGNPRRALDLYLRARRMLKASYPDGHPHLERVERRLRELAPDLIVIDSAEDPDPDNESPQEERPSVHEGPNDAPPEEDDPGDAGQR